MRIPSLAALTMLLLVVSGVAEADQPFGNIQYGSGGRYRASNDETHRKETASFSVYCYEIGTGLLVNCNVDFKVLGLADVLPGLGFEPSGFTEVLTQGGHMVQQNTGVPNTDVHSNGDVRPMQYLGGGPYLTGYNGSLLYDTTSSPPALPELKFDTKATNAYVDYALPDEGGLIAVEIDTKFYFPWLCASFCYDGEDTKSIFEIEVGAFDPAFTQSAFYQLPPEGSDYLINLGGPSLGHQDLSAGASGDANLPEEQTLGDFLDPNVMPWFYALAGLYHNDHTIPGIPSQHRLSVNDASLPVGGRFDLSENWRPPHHGHRDGVAIDINKGDESGPAIDCDFDDTLIMEVQEVMGGIDPNNSKWEALVCEFNNHENKHVNFQSPFK